MSEAEGVVLDGERTMWRSDCVFCQRTATVHDPDTGTYVPHDPICTRPLSRTHCTCDVCWKGPARTVVRRDYGPRRQRNP